MRRQGEEHEEDDETLKERLIELRGMVLMPDPVKSTPMGKVVGAPYSSPFTKFAQRPKRRPRGTPQETRSAKVRNGTL